MTALPPPTAECARLVQIMGAEGALALIEWQGSARYYVPKSVAEGDRLAVAVGIEAARALVEHSGGEAYKVPVAREWRVLILHQRGKSYAEIARQLVCSQTTVWRILNNNGRTNAQLDMFADL